MNPKHKLFCEVYMANGMNATNAYRTVYKTKHQRTSEAAGGRLLQNVEVKAYLKELQQKTAQTLNITKEELIKDLADIKNNNKDEQPNVATKAIEVLNKMLGYNEPEKVDLGLGLRDILTELTTQNDIN